MPEQFEYPKNGWSTGKMRKRGQKPDFEHAFGATAGPTGEMTPAQQVFERSRPELGESASGKATAVPSDVTMGQMMLRGPAGQLIAASALLEPISNVAKKLKTKVAAWLDGRASKDELQQALDEHGWSIHGTEAEAK